MSTLYRLVFEQSSHGKTWGEATIGVWGKNADEARKNARESLEKRYGIRGVNLMRGARKLNFRFMPEGEDVPFRRIPPDEFLYRKER